MVAPSSASTTTATTNLQIASGYRLASKTKTSGLASANHGPYVSHVGRQSHETPCHSIGRRGPTEGQSGDKSGTRPRGTHRHPRQPQRRNIISLRTRSGTLSPPPSGSRCWRRSVKCVNGATSRQTGRSAPPRSSYINGSPERAIRTSRRTPDGGPAASEPWEGSARSISLASLPSPNPKETP